VNKKVYNQLRIFDSLLNPQARNEVKDYKEGKEISIEQAKIAHFSAEVIK
jgi:hypothetical protein